MANFLERRMVLLLTTLLLCTVGARQEAIVSSQRLNQGGALGQCTINLFDSHSQTCDNSNFEPVQVGVSLDYFTQVCTSQNLSLTDTSIHFTLQPLCKMSPLDVQVWRLCSWLPDPNSAHCLKLPPEARNCCNPIDRSMVPAAKDHTMNILSCQDFHGNECRPVYGFNGSTVHQFYASLNDCKVNLDTERCQPPTDLSGLQTTNSKSGRRVLKALAVGFLGALFVFVAVLVHVVRNEKKRAKQESLFLEAEPFEIDPRKIQIFEMPSLVEYSNSPP
eukprot:m.94623 g.94623  ORF g.94623 m.94623 type:complete len:276 (-) comp13454_c0_seq2:2008-2835(-)